MDDEAGLRGNHTFQQVEGSGGDAPRHFPRPLGIAQRGPGFRQGAVGVRALGIGDDRAFAGIVTTWFVTRA